MTASQPGLPVLCGCSFDQLKPEAGGVRFTSKDANRYISLIAGRRIRPSYDTDAKLRFRGAPKQIHLLVRLLGQFSVKLATQATFIRLQLYLHARKCISCNVLPKLPTACLVLYPLSISWPKSKKSTPIVLSLNPFSLLHLHLDKHVPSGMIKTTLGHKFAINMQANSHRYGI